MPNKGRGTATYRIILIIVNMLRPSKPRPALSRRNTAGEYCPLPGEIISRLFVSHMKRRIKNDMEIRPRSRKTRKRNDVKIRRIPPVQKPIQDDIYSCVS